MRDIIASLDRSMYAPASIKFSSYTTASIAQDLLLSKLERRRRGVYGPKKTGTRCLMFIDDLNLTPPESNESRPALEVLRQWLDHGSVASSTDFQPLNLVDVQLFGLITTGSDNIPRGSFMRHFVCIGLGETNESTLKSIHGTRLTEHFVANRFPNSFVALLGNILNATIDLTQACVLNLFPTPYKAH